MKTIPLGNTGVNVSALCLGAMYFGARQDEATSFRLLDAYADAGGSFIDSANIYAHWVAGFRGGESEARWRAGCRQEITAARCSWRPKWGSIMPVCRAG